MGGTEEATMRKLQNNDRAVEYVVTDYFGDSEIGERRLAFVLDGEGGASTRMVFHPKTRGLCGSLEVVRYTKRNHAYVSLRQNGTSCWWNLTDAASKSISKQLGVPEICTNKELVIEYRRS
jgi:hypothetical protein